MVGTLCWGDEAVTTVLEGASNSRSNFMSGYSGGRASGEDLISDGRDGDFRNIVAIDSVVHEVRLSSAVGSLWGCWLLVILTKIQQGVYL